MARISYDEMLELASLGAGVMHNRSIEFAKKYSRADPRAQQLQRHPGHDDRGGAGTAGSGGLRRGDDAERSAHHVLGVPDVPGTSLEIFSRLADRKITVDMIVQNVGEKGKSDISFTVPCSELEVGAASGARSRRGGRRQRSHARRPGRQSLRRRAGHGAPDGRGQQDVRRPGDARTSTSR